MKRNTIHNDYNTEEDYPGEIKPNFSNLGNIIKIELRGGRQINFVQDDTLKHLPGFEPRVIPDDCNISDYPVDIV